MRRDAQEGSKPADDLFRYRLARAMAVERFLHAAPNRPPCSRRFVPVSKGRVDATQPFIFSADEGADIGCETGTAIAAECDVKNSTFTGTINWVELKVGEDDHSHLIDPEEHIKVLMGRQ